MFSKFFIERPKFASVLSIIIVLAGILAIRVLPLKEYPNLAPVQIVVRAYYPGADADTILKTVATPLESAINGAPHLLYIISSASSSGALEMFVFFEVGTDPESAKVEVNNRINRALPRLPEEVKRLGVEVRERSPDMLSVLFFVSKGGVRSTVNLSSFLDIYVIDELKRVPGVGDVINWLQRRYSIRVWLYPDKLAKYYLTPADVYRAIMDQNQQFSGGSLSTPPLGKKNILSFTVLGEGRLNKVKQFENIIIKSFPDGSSLRLKDIAKVEMGAERYFTVSFYRNTPGVPIGIYLRPGANALEVHKKLMKKLKELSRIFPEDIKYYEVFTITKFIKASIEEVIFTLIFSVALVMFVIYLFLGKIRTSIIPALAIPVSIVGAFAGLYAFGFSINLLTLFALVLAIGLVVDDAIVVIENAERIIEEEKLPPVEAVIKSMKEITSPIIAIVFVLSSVFIPSAFTGGFSGRFYMQFALTITIAMVLSGFVALSLTPALCAYILKPKEKPPILPIRIFEKFIAGSREVYVKGSKLLIKLSPIGVLIFLVISVLSFYFILKIPTGLVPYEDKGVLLYGGKLPPGASLYRTSQILKTISSLFKKDPDIKNWGGIGGIDLDTTLPRSDSFLGFVNLKDWSQRPPLFVTLKRLIKGFNQIENAWIFCAPVPPISGMGMVGGFEVYIQDTTGGSLYKLAHYVNKFVKEAGKRPELMFVRSSINFDVPAYRIYVDREKAEAYKVSISEIYRTIAMLFGQFYVNDFNMFGRSFHVNLQAYWKYRIKPEDYRYVFVRAFNGKLIPLSSLIHVEKIAYSPILQKFNMFPAIKVAGMAAPGYTSGEVLKAVKEVAKKVLPPGYRLSFSGMSYFEEKEKAKTASIFVITFVFVYLLLVALYESWILPIIILLTVPVGIFGASFVFFIITCVLPLPLSNNIFFKIGLLTIAGLVAKNAILLVEFAEMERKRGVALLSATLYAARVRFRPIIMTSLAFIAGAVPLLLSLGAGAMSRITVGLTVIAGMLFATTLGIFFIPLFYYLIVSARDKILAKVRKNA